VKSVNWLRGVSGAQIACHFAAPKKYLWPGSLRILFARVHILQSLQNMHEI